MGPLDLPPTTTLIDITLQQRHKAILIRYYKGKRSRRRSSAYRRTAATITPKTDIREATMLVADPVYGTDVGLTGLLVTELFEGSVAPPTSAKFAQEILVLFEKWTTKERLPKKAPMPGTMEAYGST